MDRLTPHNGVDLLIRAVPPDVPLTVAGTRGHDPSPPESAYPELLARLARGCRVRFVTGADDAEVAALYRQATVVCLPSSMSPATGGAWDLRDARPGRDRVHGQRHPVICSRLGGPAEMVRHGETGFLVEPGNVAELRDRIRAVLADRRPARCLGDRSGAFSPPPIRRVAGLRHSGVMSVLVMAG